jgi:hypothetical protein
VSPSKQRMSPEDAQKTADHARQHLACQDCGAAPGESCIHPGSGRSTCKSRFVAAAIALRRELRDADRTPEQKAVLAGLPKIPKSEFAAITTERGGLRATKEWFLEHGLPYPPIPGWRKAVETEGE